MSNEKQINSNKRKFDEEKWTELTREELVQRCKQLEKHVEQLRNVLNKTDEKDKTNKSMRQFDFSKYAKRHIFLKFFYLGWDYHVRASERKRTKFNVYLFRVLLFKKQRIKQSKISYSMLF